MNSDILKGNWKQLKGDLKRTWGKLTDDDLERIEGDSDKLVGLLQERYGEAKEDAHRKLEQFLDNHGSASKADRAPVH